MGPKAALSLVYPVITPNQLTKTSACEAGREALRGGSPRVLGTRSKMLPVIPLLISFGIRLWFEPMERGSRIGYPDLHGPLFHQWLPDGETDAVVLDQAFEFKAWFVRRGYIRGNFIEFDDSRREVDPDVMSRQAILQAGPLVGKLRVPASPNEREAVGNGTIGSAEYVALGKRVVKTLVPGVQRFLGVLRTKYGQYWLPELSGWDSRRESLGSYCSGLGLKWSLDEGVSWSKFRPTESRTMLDVRMSDFSDYLTETDWRDLQSLDYDEMKSGVGAELLTQANRFRDRGMLKYAFIEAVSALEVAVQEVARRTIARTDEIAKAVT